MTNQLDHFVEAGETISSTKQDTFCGGKGHNQSIADDEVHQALSHFEEGDELLKALIRRFPDTQIVLTLGRKGSLYSFQNTRILQPIYPVKTVDTTAAGDTYTGFFFGSLMQGESIASAMDLAARASSIAVSRPGASPSIPTRQELSGA